MVSGQHNLNTCPPLHSRSPERASHTLFYHCYGETRVIRRTVGGKAVFRDFRRVELSNAMSFYKEDQKSPFTNLVSFGGPASIRSLVAIYTLYTQV